MAYDFNGTSSYSSYRITTNLTGALSFCCWFYADALGQTAGLFSLSNDSVDRNIHLNLAGSTNYLSAQTRNGDLQTASTSVGISLATWHHGLAVFPSTLTRTVYLDGIYKATDSVASSFQDNNQRFTVGCRRTSAFGQYFNGKICEAAAWNASLTDDEALSLAKGVKPINIRPESLIFYNPLIRNSIEYTQTYGNTLGFQNNNITVVEHVRRYG